MARTPSVMVDIGTQAPDFSLPCPTDGKTYSLGDFKGAKGLLVAFICNHCPYVVHIREAFAKLAAEYKERGIAIVAISSNDVENYPADGPEKMALEAKNAGFDFPYLYDESQSVAKAYQAACTPDFFLFDSDMKLYYRGQFDDSRPKNNVPVTGDDMRAAFEELLAEKPSPEEQIPSLGCNIKWKPGNEPDYY